MQTLERPDPRTLARRDDPGTSKAAAQAAVPLAMDHQLKVLMAMRAMGRPVGAEEIAERAGLEPYQVRKRLPELARQGMVLATDVLRRTRSGRSERLHALTAAAVG